MTNDTNAPARVDRWRSALDRVPSCIAIMRAVRDGRGHVVDFRLEHLNAAARRERASAGFESAAATMITQLIRPDEQGLFEACCSVVEMRAAVKRRVGDMALHVEGDGEDGVVATWTIEPRSTGGGRAGGVFEAQSAPLQAVSDAVPDGLMVLDESGRTFFQNAANHRLFGYDDPDPMERDLESFDRVFELRELDGTPVPLERWPASRVLRGEQLSGVELVTRRRDIGREWVIRYSGQPVRDADGEVILCVVISTDVTDRKRAEQQLARAEARRRMASEIARVGTFEWNITDDVNRWSPELEALYGLAPGSFRGTYEGWAARVHPDDLAAAKAAVASALETGSLHTEWRAVWPNGTVRKLECRATVVTDEAGRKIMLGANLDITEQREAEDMLRRSAARARLGERFARRVINGVFAFIGVLELDGTLIEANQSPLDAAGIRLEDVRGKKFWDCYWWSYSEDLRAELRAACERAARGEVVRYDAVVRMAGDARMTVDFQIAPLYDDEGRVTHLVPSAVDLTDRKRAELALRASEARAKEAAERAEAERRTLDAVLDAVPAGIIVADASGRLVRFNEGVELSWGPAPLSGSVEEYREWKGWWADDGERRGRRIAPDEWAMARALRGETVRNDLVEIEPFDRPGLRRTMLNSAAPVLGAEGSIVGAVVAQMDLTALVHAEAARRESEERFRTLADNIAQLAWIADEGGWIFWYNRRWFEYTGTTLEEMKGWGWQEVHHPEHVARVVEKFRRHLESGELWEDTFPLRSAGGEYRWFLSRAVPIRDEHGRVVRWFGTNTDVTAQREAEEALRDADRRKDEFIAVLAHELRNPLAPVRHAVEIMRLIGAKDTALERARDVIDRQVAHIARLVDDLLDVSRIARGRLTLQTSLCDLAAIARQTAEDYRPSIEEALSLQVDARGPVWVEGDPVRLAQMVGNLLQNAARFTPAGGRVEVRASADVASRIASVSVTDTGVGIEPELVARLFDPFSQADQGLARSKGGLGLGLALTKGLAELHGGSVDVESAGQGAGSTFTLRIPLSVRRYERAANVAEAPGRAHGLRVLVVEDNVDSAETLGSLLSLAGHEVEITYDAGAGIAAARAHRPDVVISDIGLPGKLDGYDVARQLRAEMQQVYLIALSGYANDDARRRSRDAGFDVHFAKPPDLGALRRTLADVRRS